MSCPADTRGATATSLLLLVGRGGGAGGHSTSSGEGGPQRGAVCPTRGSASRATSSLWSACPGNDGASDQVDMSCEGRMKEGPGQPPPQPSSPGGLPCLLPTAPPATSPRPLALPPVPPSSPSPAITPPLLLLLLPFTQPQPWAVGASPPSLGALPCVQAPCPAVGTPTPYPPPASPSPCPGRCCPASQSPGSGLHVEQAGGWRSPAGPAPRDRERARAVEGERPGDPVSPPARPGKTLRCEPPRPPPGAPFLREERPRLRRYRWLRRRCSLGTRRAPLARLQPRFSNGRGKC